MTMILTPSSTQPQFFYYGYVINPSDTSQFYSDTYMNYVGDTLKNNIGTSVSLSISRINNNPCGTQTVSANVYYVCVTSRTPIYFTPSNLYVAVVPTNSASSLPLVVGISVGGLIMVTLIAAVAGLVISRRRGRKRLASIDAPKFDYTTTRINPTVAPLYPTQTEPEQRRVVSVYPDDAYSAFDMPQNIAEPSGIAPKAFAPTFITQPSAKILIDDFKRMSTRNIMVDQGSEEKRNPFAPKTVRHIPVINNFHKDFTKFSQ